MTIERLSKELDRPAAMSSTESIGDTERAEMYENSPLLAKKTPPQSSTPPSKRNSHASSNSRWTISSLATHQENTTEVDVLRDCSTPTINRSDDKLNSRDLHLRLQPSHNSPLMPLRRHARSRSASLPFLMLSNLQIQAKPEPTSLKVVVLGESSVGKSSVVHQFLSCVDTEWPDNDNYITEETEQTYCKSVSVDEDDVNLEIVDTPAYSSDEFEEREEEYLGNGDAFLLVYSVTSRRSFKKANELRFKLQRSKESETVPIILVGNKTDLERSREVSFAEGKHFAALFDCKLIETSATLGHNIDELFHGVVRQVRLRKEKQLEEERP